MSIEKVKFALSVIESNAKDQASKNALEIIAEYLDSHKGQEVDQFVADSERAWEAMSLKISELTTEANDMDLYSLRGLAELIRDGAEDLLEEMEDREEELTDAPEEDEESLEEDEEEVDLDNDYDSDDDDDFDYPSDDEDY